MTTLDDDVLSVVNQYTHANIKLKVNNKNQYELDIELPWNYKLHYIELLKLKEGKIKRYLCPYHIYSGLIKKNLIDEDDFYTGGTWYPNVVPWIFLYKCNS